MKVANLPSPKLRANPEEIGALTARLKELNYREEVVAERLGLRDLSELDAAELPRYVWEARRESTALGQLMLLFLLGEGLSRQEATSLLGREAISALMVSDVLFRRDGRLFSRLVLYPCLGSFIFTDYWVTAGKLDQCIANVQTVTDVGIPTHKPSELRFRSSVCEDCLVDVWVRHVDLTCPI